MKSMNILNRFLLPVVLALTLGACSNDDDTPEKDTEKPKITVQYEHGFPQACSELKRGQTYEFTALATDNYKLASYSIDIHHNFDHHTHDDQGAQCELWPVKTAVKPFIFMKNYEIPGGQEYEVKVSITIPADVDTGDYHCMFSVLDDTGWQGRTSIDIKIVEQ